jgi:hypothetical protein
MNKKYKPGIYFGIYTTVMSFFIPFIIHLSPANKYNIGVLIIASVIGGIAGGSIFGLIWNMYKKRQTRNL